MTIPGVSFTDRLRDVQSRQDSMLCIGLDVDPARLPTHLSPSPAAVMEFVKRIIDATHDLVCAYKPNLAFYESLGASGWEILKRTVEFVPVTLIRIGDGKRGDIGNTAERYAKALFDGFGFDAVTVNPLMGFDSVEPFLRRGEKGAFILALTSNPGSQDFQRLKAGAAPLYERIVSSAVKWNTNRNVGLVAGATHPKELRRIRSLAPDLPILLPGIGAQGGDARSAVQFGCDETGSMAVISVSRSVVYASTGKDFAQAARREAAKLRDEFRLYRDKFFGQKGSTGRTSR